MSAATEEEITAACHAHGAQNVSEAAYLAMRGDRSRLDAVGLGHVRGIAALDAIASAAFKLMSPAERASDLADATIDIARVTSRKA